jgi:threonyl-tRNA synthetase
MAGKKRRSLDADSENSDPLYRARHSLAHLMAHAVLDLRPGSKRGFGPPIDTGFYYDFVLTEPLTTDDFPKIEARMRELIEEDFPFELETLPMPDAYARLSEMGEPYKLEYAKELAAKQGLSTLSFYRSGRFLDMCEGPHVARSSDLRGRAFKLHGLAGAYWRGDEKNQMMTRVYAWGFLGDEDLERHVERYEAAQQFDHKKLGPQLELYTIDPMVGRGLPLWLPNGTVLREELEKLARAKEFEAGFVRVKSPEITRGELYERSRSAARCRYGVVSGSGSRCRWCCTRARAWRRLTCRSDPSRCRPVAWAMLASSRRSVSSTVGSSWPSRSR